MDRVPSGGTTRSASGTLLSKRESQCSSSSFPPSPPSLLRPSLSTHPNLAAVQHPILRGPEWNTSAHAEEKRPAITFAATEAPSSLRRAATRPSLPRISCPARISYVNRASPGTHTHTHTQSPCCWPVLGLAWLVLSLLSCLRVLSKPRFTPP